MTPELIFAIMVFAFASSITPGPNNLMLLSSGANFGFARSIPHMLGIAGGWAVLISVVGLGLMKVFTTYPVIYSVLKVACVAYLLFLAWKIATAASPTDDYQRGKPFTFMQAALFQWINPKGIAMAITVISVYTPPNNPGAVLLAAAVASSVNLPCVSVWAVLGVQMRKLVDSPRKLRVFNITMAVLLILSLYPVLVIPV